MSGAQKISRASRASFFAKLRPLPVRFGPRQDLAALRLPSLFLTLWLFASFRAINSQPSTMNFDRGLTPVPFVSKRPLNEISENHNYHPHCETENGQIHSLAWLPIDPTPLATGKPHALTAQHP